MIFNGLSIEQLILLIPPLLFALCFHEFSHAYVAYLLGDHTAAKRGRLTLNPLAHLDPFGSLMIIFVGFGWAKPVPVDPRYFKNSRIGMMQVAFAGPASNLLLALVGGLIIRYFGSSMSEIIIKVSFNFTMINLALCFFNLIPVHPLDGSQIFSGFMIKRNPEMVYKLHQYGPNILFGLILFGFITKISIIWYLIGPFVQFFLRLFTGY
ncbi:MAG: site-2 protease family protein [Candidatus Neomarinimicrobiota bacterium]|nr:site-2 protease family protein [Candidatus Neomarinimicrobiota bacterium]